MKIAAQLYTVRELLRERAQMPHVLRRLRAMGYEFVEVAGIRPTAAELAGAEVRVCATHESLETLKHNLDGVLEWCAAWDCRYVVIPSAPPEYRTGDGFRRLAREAQDIAGRLRPHGITLAYHNHDFELGLWDGRIGLEMLFGAAPPEVLAAELDTYWLQFAGADPLDWMARFGSRLKLLHLKDMTADGEQAEVGGGVTDWTAVLSACRDAGTEWLVVEHDDPEGDPLASLAVSHRNLVELLRRT